MKALRRWCALVSVILIFHSLPVNPQQVRQTLAGHVEPAVSSGLAKLVGVLPPAQRLDLSIVLSLRNQDQLTNLLSRLYDPSSPDYHHFLSVAQFTEQFGPSAEDYRRVSEFATAQGLTVTGEHANRLVVPVSGTTEQIQRTFNVAMKVYRHPTESRNFFSADHEPSLALNVSIAHIVGLNNFSLPKSMAIRGSADQCLTSGPVEGSGPGGSYLSRDMRAAYYGGTALTGSGQTVGILQFDGYNISDVVASFDGTASATSNGSNYVLTYTPVAGGTTYTIPINNVLLDGATGSPGQFQPPADDAEQALDIVQAIGMAPGLSQVRVYIGSSDVDILSKMASDNLAKQISISWAWYPDDPSTDDVFFKEFAAQGQSVFVASGDYGAYSPSVPNYYPAEDAWVTAVGGTSMTTNGAGGALTSEVAWGDSGGGISPDGIPIPSWQAGVANSSNEGSTTLRNVPDVAMEGDYDNYDCSMGDCAGTWAGTSFAAPRWAGFMALVNQQAAAAGNPTVGFINPWIYTTGASADYGSEFHDTAAGENNYEPGYGFYAVPGYDLVTGWGSPAGQNLINGMAPVNTSVGFQLSTSASSLVINPGSYGTSTIAVIGWGGFAGSVDLSVTSELPSGVTASFDTNPTSGSSVLTITASPSAVIGSYLVTITGVSGATSATTYITVNTPVDAVTIISPVVPQVPVTSLMVKPGTPIPIQGTVLSNFQDLRLEWARGINPASGWSSTGMTMSGGMTSPVINQTIGTWDTSSIIAADYYTIRLSADYPDTTVSATTLVYLEPDLISANWPKWLNATPASYSGIIPFVDGSGKTNLAIVEPSYFIETAPARYRVFSPDGSSDTSTALVSGNWFTPAWGDLAAGDGGESLVGDARDVFVLPANGISYQMTTGVANVAFNDSQVELADLKGDGSLETLAMGYQTSNNLGFVYAWSSNGQILNSNFPIQVPFQGNDLSANNPGFVAGDIDGNGNQKIIVQEASSTATFTLGLFANDGTALSWSAPTFQGVPSQMILADLDHNGKLEVILDASDPNTNQHVLHVLQPDGTERKGWPFNLGYGAVYLAAGDLARTGIEQIVVVAYNHLYVFNGDGTPFSSAWPLTTSTFSPFGPIALADIDGDGYPEILVTTGDFVFPQDSSEVTSIAVPMSRVGDGSLSPAYVQTNSSGTNSTPEYFAPTLMALHRDGALAKSWNLHGINGNQPYFWAHITVGDFNQDGKTEIAVETPLISGGTVDGWLVEGMMEVLTTGATFNPSANEWPMMLHDTRNSATSASAYPVAAQAATPVLAPAAGSYVATQMVTITDATPGAIIYYTTDGTTPGSSSSVYSSDSPIAVSCTQSVKAIAIAAGDAPSAITTTAYTFPVWAAPPDFAPYPGTYDIDSPVAVTITDTTPGAVIYYTTNGSIPTINSTLYTGPVTVSITETIQALAVAKGYLPGESSITYTVTPPAATPILSLASGTYSTPQPLTISDTTPGAVIYYSTNGGPPTTGSSVYNGQIMVSSSETVEAMAMASGYSQSAVVSASYAFSPAATPTFTPAAGVYTGVQLVSIFDATPSATIYYTVDGSTPNTGSSVYSIPITVSSSEIIQAIAAAAGYSTSAVASASYSISPAATPTFTPAAGIYTSVQSVSISDVTLSAAIYYTIDGSNPTINSTLYTGPITISATETTIRAIATCSGCSASALAAAQYIIILPAAAPTFLPAAGTYFAPQTVTISDATAGVVIYYTTNGSTPTTSSPVYSAPITILASETVKAMASGSNSSGLNSASSVASAPYVITPPAATPTLLPPAGSYTTRQSVTISDATSGAVIYYTTDGSTPTSGSSVYSGPLTVSAIETIQAMASCSGCSNSNVGSASYAVMPPVGLPLPKPAPPRGTD